MMEIDNRNKKAKDFYKSERPECVHCGSLEHLNTISDGFETMLCDDCMELALEDLGFCDDFYAGKRN